MGIANKLREEIKIKRIKFVLYILAGVLIGLAWGMYLMQHANYKSEQRAWEKFEEQRKSIENPVNLQE